MSEALHALGIDLGTTGLKVGLFDTEGRLRAAASRPLSTTRGEAAGAGPAREAAGAGLAREAAVAEQDAGAIWRALVEAVRQVLAEAEVAPQAVAAIGSAAQYASLVAVDDRARPLAPMLLWLDRRGGDHSRAILERHPQAAARWRALHGLRPLPHGGDGLSHLLHLQHDRPELWRRTAAVLEPVDYLTARLSGRLTATQQSMFMSLLVDNRSRGITAYAPELLAMAGVDARRLPPLVPCDRPLGGLCDAAARELGLPPATAVLPGLNDTQALALASASSADGGGLSIGTTSVLVTPLQPRAAGPEGGALLPMPGPLETGYVVMAENGLGGKVLEYFLLDLVHVDDALGAHASPTPFAGLEQAVERTPPGAGGVLFMPWLAGSLAPRPSAHARGGFLNLSLDTTREALARSVLEGVAHNLRWLLEPVERFAGHPLGELVFTGGGARSAGWGQILADVLDRPVVRLADPVHANCRAVALLALHRVGRLPRQAVTAPRAVAQVHRPRPEHRPLYSRMHRQFVAAFEQNHPIFQGLNA